MGAVTELHTPLVKNRGLDLARLEKDQTAVCAIDLDKTAGLAVRLPLKDRFHRLDNGDRVAIGADIVVGERPHLRQTLAAQGRGPAELDVRDFLEILLEDLNAIAAL